MCTLFHTSNLDYLVATVTLVASDYKGGGVAAVDLVVAKVLGVIVQVVVMEVVMEGVEDSVQGEIAAASCTPSSLSRQRR